MQGEFTADDHEAVACMSLESKGHLDQHLGCERHKVKFIGKTMAGEAIK